MKNQIIHTSYANINFEYPHCNKKYSDINDVYLNRCNKNKTRYTKIKCSCGKFFGMTYDHMDNAVGFELN